MAASMPRPIPSASAFLSWLLSACLIGTIVAPGATPANDSPATGWAAMIDVTIVPWPSQSRVEPVDRLVTTLRPARTCTPRSCGWKVAPLGAGPASTPVSITATLTPVPVVTGHTRWKPSRVCAHGNPADGTPGLIEQSARAAVRGAASAGSAGPAARAAAARAASNLTTGTSEKIRPAALLGAGPRRLTTGRGAVRRRAGPALGRGLCGRLVGDDLGGREGLRLGLLLRRRPLLVVLAHALDLGLEDPQGPAERAGHVRELLPAEEQHQRDDREHDEVAGREQFHQRSP